MKYLVFFTTPSSPYEENALFDAVDSKQARELCKKAHPRCKVGDILPWGKMSPGIYE